MRPPAKLALPATARIQRVLVLAWMMAVLAAAWQALVVGPQLLTVLALIFLVFGHAMVLGAEFALMAIINRRSEGVSSRWHKLMHAWLQECLTAMRVFAWQQPFRSRACPDHLLETHRGRRGILLVHGFACNRGLWLRWLERLIDLDVPTIAVDMDPPWAPIGSQRMVIEEAVTRLEHVTGLPPIIVAHSMGGLAARDWWAQTNPDRVHRLVTVGTPQHGTWMARFGLSPNVRQMRPRSQWIQQLFEREGQARRSRITCCYSRLDNIVFPLCLARLEGADHRLIPDEPHLRLVWSADIWLEALQWLDVGSPESPIDR